MRALLVLALALTPLASAHGLLDPARDAATEVQGLLRVQQTSDAALPSGSVAGSLPDGRLAVASLGVVRVYGGSGLVWEATLPFPDPPTKVVASRTTVAVDVPDAFEQRWAVFDLQGGLLYIAGTPGEDPQQFRTFAADDTGFWVVHQTAIGGPRRDSLQYRAPDNTLRWELGVTPTQYIFRVQPLGQGRSGIAVYTNTTGGMDLRVVSAAGAFEAVFAFAEDGTSPVEQPLLAEDAQGDLLATVAKEDGSAAAARLSADLKLHRWHAHPLANRAIIPAGLAGAPDGGLAVFATSRGVPPLIVAEPVMLRFGPCGEACPLAWTRTLFDTKQGIALGGSVEGSALRFAFTRECLALEAYPLCDLAPREVRLAGFVET